jgi:hypothetical protein
MATGKVYAVDEVRVGITRKGRPLLLILALGRTSTNGWSNGALSQYIYLTPPADGVQEFDFIADMSTPGTPVLNVLTPITAHAEMPDVDIENHWGPGKPLKGIRVHAVANSKLVDVVSRKEASARSAKMSPRATVSYLATDPAGEVLGFEEDIKPLFRPVDVSSMLAFGSFDLSKYDDVKANAENILARLKDDMPCDGLWPATDIAKFETWKDGGMPP